MKLNESAQGKTNTDMEITGKKNVTHMKGKYMDRN